MYLKEICRHVNITGTVITESAVSRYDVFC